MKAKRTPQTLVIISLICLSLAIFLGCEEQQTSVSPEKISKPTISTKATSTPSPVQSQQQRYPITAWVEFGQSSQDVPKLNWKGIPSTNYMLFYYIRAKNKPLAGEQITGTSSVMIVPLQSPFELKGFEPGYYKGVLGPGLGGSNEMLSDWFEFEIK